MDCPSFETILAAAESAPDAELARHLAAGCSSCADRLATARTLLRVLAADPLEDVPAELHRRAVALGEGRDSLGERIREWVASFVAPPAAAVPAFRGSAAPMQRLYRAGPFEVDLALLSDGVLVGQLTGEEDDLPAGGYVVLYGDGRADTSSLSEDGEFRFEGVAPGPHVLVVRSGDASVVVPDLEIDLG